MKDATRNVMVGVFVLASIVVLGVVMVWFGEAPDWLGTSDWTLRITGVREIRGIGEGAPVLLNGVKIGRVSSLDFEDPDRPELGVMICTLIERDYSVPRGAIAKVYGSTFGLGSGEVNILLEPGLEGGVLNREGQPQIPGEMASMVRELIPEDFTASFQRTVDHIGDLAEATTPLAESLAKLLEERSVAVVTESGAAEKGITANLTTMIERLDELVANVNAVLGDENVQGEVKGVARDLKDASENIKELVELWQRESQRVADNVNEGIDRTDDNLNRSLTKLIEVLEHLDDGVKSFAAVSGEVARGEGTVGRLVFDERLYESAVLALERLTELIDRLDRIFADAERKGYISLEVKTPIGMIPRKLPVRGKEDAGG